MIAIKHTANNILIFFLLTLVVGCATTSKIKDGMTAYQYKKYSKAVGLLKSEYQSSRRQDVQAEKAYYLGESFIKLNDYVKANEWFEISERLGYGTKAINGLAETYKNLEKYNLAIDAYEKLSKLIPGDLSIKSKIFICNEAIRWNESAQSNFTVNKLLKNSNYAEYSPAFYEDDWLVFTSDSEAATGSKRYDWTGNKKSDLFLVGKKGGEIRKFDGLINSSDNEGTAVFSRDYNEMIFTRCFEFENAGDEYCKLMVSYRKEGVWTEPLLLPFIKKGINYGQPALIENDSVLVFSSMSSDQANGYDLWYSVRENNTWSNPFPMPKSINTQGNEHFPTADGDTLYFSSDYLPGLGGLDIFKTYLKPDGSWANPVNIKPPLNSGADDFGIIIDRLGKKERDIDFKGYFSSNRSKEGHEEIFYFEKYKVESPEEKPTELEEDEDDAQKVYLYLAGKVLEHVFFEEDNPNSGIKSNKPIENPYVKVTDNQKNQLEISANKNGLFIGNISSSNTYQIVVKKQGYLNQVVELDPKTYNIPVDAKNYTINMDIFLEKIYVGKEIILDNIYYDFNESFIREDAKPTLNALANKIIQNPQIKIELSSHTDCRGEVEFNQRLSQQRAQAAVDYLISKGIDQSRLFATGYGKSSPIINCKCDECTEEQHQQNRRTSFKVLE